MYYFTGFQIFSLNGITFLSSNDNFETNYYRPVKSIKKNIYFIFLPGFMQMQKMPTLAIVEKLTMVEGLFYEKKVTREVLQEFIDVVNDHLDEVEIFKENSLEEECAFAIYIILERLKMAIQLEDKIMQIIEDSSTVFTNEIDMRTDIIRNIIYAAQEQEKIKLITASNSQEKIYPTPKNTKQKRTNYPKKVSKILKDWLATNIVNPYPSENEKVCLSDRTGLDQTQINNWFINARRRILPLLRQQIKK